MDEPGHDGTVGRRHRSPPAQQAGKLGRAVDHAAHDLHQYLQDPAERRRSGAQRRSDLAERRYEGDVTYSQSFCQYGKTSSPEASTGPNTSLPLYGATYPDCAIKQWVTVGLGYTYTRFKHWNLNANIQNLFDVKAPYDPTVGTTLGYNSDLHNAYGRYFNVSALHVLTNPRCHRPPASHGRFFALQPPNNGVRVELISNFVSRVDAKVTNCQTIGL